MQLKNLNEAFTWQINPVFQSRIESQNLDLALWSNLQTQIEALCDKVKRKNLDKDVGSPKQSCGALSA